jgi:transposase-like protein
MCNNLKCKYCGSNNINKDGIVNNGNQRYLCRDCKKTFTITKRKYSEEYKLKIIKMYLENVGIRKQGRTDGSLLTIGSLSVVRSLPKEV